MFPCEQCGKVYSTKHSRSSHRYVYHKKPAIVDTEHTTDSDVDDINTNRGSDHEDVASNVDEDASDSEHSLDVDAEVDKEAKTDKFPCEQCGKMYSTKHSRSSHRYKYHKTAPTGKHATKPDTDDNDPRGSVHEEVTSNIDELGSDSEHSLETEDEVDKNPKTSSKYYTGDSDDDSDASRFDKGSGKSRRKQFARRYQPYQTDRFADKKLDKILEEIEALGNKLNQNPINVNNAINHPQLIKILCKAVLDGGVPLQKSHIDALKPHRETVRKIADGRPATRKKLIQSEVDRHNRTGESVLNTILDRVLNLLPVLFK